MLVITDLGILRQNRDDGELRLIAVHDGVDINQVHEATGWELRVEDALDTTPPVTTKELQALRRLQAGEDAS